MVPAQQPQLVAYPFPLGQFGGQEHLMPMGQFGYGHPDPSNYGQGPQGGGKPSLNLI